VSRAIVLLRGINVGGRNRLSMADLRDLLAELDCQDVETYVQSGNAVVRTDAGSDGLAVALQRAILARHGFEPAVLVRSAAELANVIAANPFAAKTALPTTVHVYFLEGTPVADAIARLEALRAPDETFVLTGSAFYLHAPSGIGRSRLVKNLEAALGTPATGRNWRTVEALAQLADR
jgi:uncharacterized protein (DUF1697 family)